MLNINSHNNNQFLITDLDNTLYNWKDFFAPSFRAMVHVIARQTKLNEDQLMESFKRVYSKHRNLEYPFAIQELDIWTDLMFTTESVEKIVKTARTAFSLTRSKHLHLYPKVKETLEWLKEHGIYIIGFTKAELWHAEKRLKKLHIDKYFDHLISKFNLQLGEQEYAAIEATRSLKNGIAVNHEKSAIQLNIFESNSLIKSDEVKRIKYRHNLKTGVYDTNKRTELDNSRLKPSISGLNILSEKYNLSPEFTFMIGDSLLEDVAFAQKVGFKDIWAKYGISVNAKNEETMRKITYWSESDIDDFYEALKKIKPTFQVEEFSELRSIIKPRQISLTLK